LFILRRVLCCRFLVIISSLLSVCFLLTEYPRSKLYLFSKVFLACWYLLFFFFFFVRQSPHM
jgi:hypothetical protein